MYLSLITSVLQARINLLATWDDSALRELAEEYGLLYELPYSELLHYLAEELPHPSGSVVSFTRIKALVFVN